MPVLDSSLLESVEYDEERQELVAQFRASGRRYVYAGIPPDIYEGLLAAPSAGAYFNRRIRDRYPYREL
jgi:hypothetical protein